MSWSLPQVNAVCQQLSCCMWQPPTTLPDGHAWRGEHHVVGGQLSGVGGPAVGAVEDAHLEQVVSAADAIHLVTPLAQQCDGRDDQRAAPLQVAWVPCSGAVTW